ncbi:MAG: diguanylate cyclase [Burkholderiales bacterium]|nr:diguanylate cyclase [Burkholderiales bacterium]
MRWNIGQRLGLLLASFSVLAALVLGYLTYTAARDMLEQRAQRTLQRTARVLAAQLQSGFDSVGRDATVLAHLAASPTVQQAAAHRQVLADAFQSLLLARPAYLQVRFVGMQDHGLELVRVHRQADGRVARTPDAQLQEKAHFPFVFETRSLAPGQVYLGDFGTSLDEAQGLPGEAVFSVAAPVVAGTDVVGVVEVRVDASVFLARVSAGLPEPYGFYLANRWGDYLVHPERSKAFGFERGERVLVQEEFPSTAALLDGAAAEQGFAKPDAQGMDQAYAFLRVPQGAPESGRFLVMGLSEPMAAVQADVQQLGRSMLQMLAVVALAALLLAAGVSRVVTGPLRTVMRAAEAFSQGRSHGDLPVARQDELGELARSFADMEEQIRRQMHELNRSRDAMAHLVHHDPLTGLPNRRMFEQRLQEAIERAQRSGRSCMVVFVDLDGFKAVNDKLGHAVGDAVLQAAARTIRGAVRQVDTVARLAGDEFTVLCENVDTEADAQRVLAKLRRAFEEPLQIEGRPMAVRASMGVSRYPQDAPDAHTLLASADAAMYRSKKQRCGE